MKEYILTHANLSSTIIQTLTFLVPSWLAYSDPGCIFAYTIIGFFLFMIYRPKRNSTILALIEFRDELQRIKLNVK